MVVVVVPLALAAAASATPAVPLFNTAYGPITSLTPRALTVQANAQIPTTCASTAGSPSDARFTIGDHVTIACKQGVLVSITRGHGSPRLGPVIPIPGLTESFDNGLPAPGPPPTQKQCAAAWNEYAPLASREAIGSLSPLAVEVYRGSSDAVSPPPNTHQVAQGPTCDIMFVLPGARTAQVTSNWKQGTAKSWRGFIDGGYPHLFVTEPGFTVSPDGTVTGPG
jgi:hypothetical protein